MSRRTVTWQMKRRAENTLVIFSGIVDEDSDFSELLDLKEEVVFDLEKIKHFSSDGVRLWINLINSLSQVTELTWVKCSIATVSQLNMIEGFKGKAKVKSFFTPYFCEATGDILEKLLLVDDLADPLHPPVFPVEGGVLEIDDIPQRYFAFLLEPDE